MVTSLIYLRGEHMSLGDSFMDAILEKMKSEDFLSNEEKPKTPLEMAKEALPDVDPETLDRISKSQAESRQRLTNKGFSRMEIMLTHLFIGSTVNSNLGAVLGIDKFRAVFEECVIIVDEAIEVKKLADKKENKVGE